VTAHASTARWQREADDHSAQSVEQRAAYLEELEERAAARRELARRNGGISGAAGGAWGLSFLPYLF